MAAAPRPSPPASRRPLYTGDGGVIAADGRPSPLDSTPTRFPYQIGLVMKDEFDQAKFYCGGVLIRNDTVLTAAQ